MRTARHVLRRWVLTHHYRELIATDFLVESRRLRSRGANLRAALLLPLVAVLGPRMGLNRIRAIRGAGEVRRSAR